MRRPVLVAEAHGNAMGGLAQGGPSGPHRVVADRSRRVAPPGELDVDLVRAVRADLGLRIVEQPEHDIGVEPVHPSDDLELVETESQGFLGVDLGAVPIAASLR